MTAPGGRLTPHLHTLEAVARAHRERTQPALEFLSRDNSQPALQRGNALRFVGRIAGQHHQVTVTPEAHRIRMPA